MNVVVTEIDIRKEICDILGLDPNKTQEIHIHITPDDKVTIDIKQFLYIEDAKKMITLFKSYSLMENDTNETKPYNCSCLEIAGQLNYSQRGVPISDCVTCHGTGYIENPTKFKVGEV